MEKISPPLQLVETWLEIAGNDNFPDAQEIANRNLQLNFDNINQAKHYVELEMLKLGEK